MVADRFNRAARRVPVWTVYVGLMLPAPWLFWQAATGGLGFEPIEALEHRLGEFALQLLIAGLAVTPLRRFAGVNLLRFRRALGLACFFYLCLHLLVWLLLDVQDPARIVADILKRPYITVGMAGFALLVPLAVTSTDRAVRRLGPRWRRLHRLVYPAALLGGLHYAMLAKGFQPAPLVYLGMILALLALRMKARRRVSGKRVATRSRLAERPLRR